MCSSDLLRCGAITAACPQLCKHPLLLAQERLELRGVPQVLLAILRQLTGLLGRPELADDVLDMSGLTGILSYDPAELVLTARAGTPLSEIGKTAFKLPEGVKMNALTAVDVRVTHPNDTGFELNNQTVMYIPPHFVRSIKVSYGERKLFDAELDFSISENPQFRFNFLPHAPDELKAEVEDSRELHYRGSLAVQ